MENIVYLQLRKKYQDVYYYKTVEDYEVDFFVPKERVLIQVSQHFDAPATQERELRAIVRAAKDEKKTKNLIIVTESEKSEIERENLQIQVIPLYEWLLWD